MRKREQTSHSTSLPAWSCHHQTWAIRPQIGHVCFLSSLMALPKHYDLSEGSSTTPDGAWRVDVGKWRACCLRCTPSAPEAFVRRRPLGHQGKTLKINT